MYSAHHVLQTFKKESYLLYLLITFDRIKLEQRALQQLLVILGLKEISEFLDMKKSPQKCYAKISIMIS